MLEVVMFLLGAIAGGTGCYVILTRSRSETAIEQQLRDLQEEFTAYRENVNQHFNRTADLVNTLTESYVKVQKHLEDASVSLSEPPKSFKLENSHQLAPAAPQFIAIETKEPPAKDASFDDERFQPPRDYAPKVSAKEKGTLAEDFGFNQSHP